MLKKLLLASVFTLPYITLPAVAQNTTCATRAAGDSSNACASTAFVHGGFQPTLPNFTANNPLIGNGTNVPTQGTRQGSTTVFPTIDGTSVNGQCAVFDSLGGLTSQACATAGSGTVGSGLQYQFAYYAANGTSVVGTPITETPQMFGATGNGSTDDTTAINAWLADISTKHICGFLPAATYKITAALNTITVGNWCIVGAGSYQSIIEYAGASTTSDIMAISGASIAAPIHNISISHIGFTSQTVMTASSSALLMQFIDLSILKDVNFDQWPQGNSNLYNGVSFVGSNFITYDGANIWVSHDGIQAWDGVELILDHMTLNYNGNSAVHIGGGFGGLYMGAISASGANIGTFGLLVDTAIYSAGNNQIFISSNTAFDTFTAAGIYLNDAITSNKSLQFDGWSSSCQGAACNGLVVNNWANGNIQIGGGAQLLSNGASVGGNGIFINDGTAHMTVDPAALISGSGDFGIYCNVTNNNIVTMGLTNAVSPNPSGDIGGACHGDKIALTPF